MARYQRAVEFFEHALALAQVTQSSEKSWVTTHLNLGTCYRKLKYVMKIEALHDHPNFIMV